LRSLIESAVCLLLAVIVFRTFAAEGYMISTGSMAPHLLGFHKRVECPSCRFTFPFGVAYDTDADPAGISAAEEERGRTHAVCPNCGQRGINLAQVPRNHGDQLLVFKPAYALRPPRRWEIIVFRNPQNPKEAYVKRVVGLPGERIQIIDGDVYADGELCRKDAATQRQLRVPVHLPTVADETAEDWLARWTPLPVTEGAALPWEARDGRFVHAARDATDWGWVEYVGRVRYRGKHETVVQPVSWPDDIDPAAIPPAGLKYDPRANRLSCIGALPETVRDRLLEHPAPDEFHAAVRRLYDESRAVPITDEYGYNPHDGSIQPTPLRDVMVELTLEQATGTGEFALEMTDGHANYTCSFDMGRQTVRLYAADQADPVAEATLPAGFGARPMVLGMSLIDRQVLVTLDGEPCLAPWPLRTPEAAPYPRYPVRFGAQGLAVTVSEPGVYRDVYYTGTRSRNAVQSPYQLGDQELFVLGDNSPVSHDSRRWADGAVPLSHLVGKPFVVHLPSKPGRLKLGSWEAQLRLPDVARMQWLP
jgi:signal peptidase I